MHDIHPWDNRQTEKINSKIEHTFKSLNDKRRHLYEQKHEKETLQLE